MKKMRKNEFVPPKFEITVLECEDIITTSNTLATGIDGSIYGAAGTGLTWYSVYGEYTDD